MDRRIKKSKQAIMDALIHLMSEKNFESITINEIAKTADLNRGTVYLHYVDKYDLLDQCIDFHLNHLVANCVPGENIRHTPKSAMISTFEYLEQDALFYTAMLTNKGIPSFKDRILTMIKENFSKQMDLIHLDKNLNKEIHVQFLASAITGVLEWWFTHSIPYPPAVMVEQFWMFLEHIQPSPLDFNSST